MESFTSHQQGTISLPVPFILIAKESVLMKFTNISLLHSNSSFQNYSKWACWSASRASQTNRWPTTSPKSIVCSLWRMPCLDGEELIRLVLQIAFPEDYLRLLELIFITTWCPEEKISKTLGKNNHIARIWEKILVYYYKKVILKDSDEFKRKMIHYNSIPSTSRTNTSRGLFGGSFQNSVAQGQ